MWEFWCACMCVRGERRERGSKRGGREGEIVHWKIYQAEPAQAGSVCRLGKDVRGPISTRAAFGQEQPLRPLLWRPANLHTHTHTHTHTHAHTHQHIRTHANTHSTASGLAWALDRYLQAQRRARRFEHLYVYAIHVYAR